MQKVTYSVTENVAESWDEFLDFVTQRSLEYKTSLGEIYWMDSPHPGMVAAGISFHARLPDGSLSPVDVLYLPLMFVSDTDAVQILRDPGLRTQLYSRLTDLGMVESQAVSRPTG